MNLKWIAAVACAFLVIFAGVGVMHKIWNNNGTTSIITYKPSTQQPVQSQEEIVNKILQKVENLENKISELTQPYPIITTTSAQGEIKKREVNLNEF